MNTIGGRKNMETQLNISDLLHYGEPAQNVGCQDTNGAWLWDSQAHRRAAWADAQDALKSAPSELYREFVVKMGRRAGEAHSSRALDKLETNMLGEVVTAGTYPKRQRFWRFVDMAARGIVPRDLA